MTGQNKLAEKKFIDVKEAYDTLRDESKRREYDATIYVDQDQRPKHGYQSWDNSTQQQYYKKNYYTPEDFDRVVTEVLCTTLQSKFSDLEDHATKP
jgi:DnaJ-class molecular chaperone